MTNQKDYIPTVSGLAVGARGDEVERIQAYLAKFGYLESPVVEGFSIDTMREPALTVEKGVFDDNTAQALRNFQAFNNLPVSGVLDAATLALMGTMRCANPDIGEYANTGRKWPTNNLTYGFQEFTPDLSQGIVINAIDQAFSLWSAVTPLRFRRVAMSANPHIIIRFAAGDHGDGFAFDGPSGVLAHAFYPPVASNPPTPIQGDTHFDEAETWTVTIPPPSGTIDLVSVAAHEFGHSLGLGHTSVNKALMYPYYGGPHRFLHTDDINGIHSIYGWPKIAHAMWVHANSIQIEYPDRIEWMQRYGFYTRIIGKPNTENWFHFAIPAPVIVDNDRKLIGSVILRFRTLSTHAVVRDVHIYDGWVRIATHNGVNLTSNHWFERFGVASVPPALWGLGISIGVEFGTGSATNRRMDFVGAGCDFRP